ncbi:MAG: NADH-quinone oxidoreductase subunit N [Planctomycetes bacterium]|nr:NADH-quinone oxidoreductase subunit N [Planctomycetota bacterium]
MTWDDIKGAMPVIAPVLAALAILVRGSARRSGQNPMPPAIALAGFLFTLITIAVAWPVTSRPLFAGALRSDNLGLFAALLSTLAGIGTVLISVDYLKRRGRNHAEYYALVLFGVTGMSVMGMSSNLLSLLLGLELMSLVLYVLAGFFREESRSIESSIKYFLTGSFATGLFLFGMGLVYGASGSLDLDALGLALADSHYRSLALVGVGFLVAGFAFKIAAAPFHMWLPDVYEGAPTPVTAFMATGVKIAAFTAIVRVFSAVYQVDNDSLRSALWWIAVLTMSVGNLAALVQKNVKRMLAYSAIAHAGYLLVALVAMRGEPDEGGALSFGTSEAARGILYYLLAYLTANLGAFGVLSHFEREGGKGLDYEDLSGLRAKYPFLSLALALFMLSLAGIPGTAGFIGKLLVFGSAVETGAALDRDSFVLLAILGILNSLVGLYYYLRVLIQLYVKDLPDTERDRLPVMASPAFGGVIVIAFAATIWLGVGPDFFHLGLGVEPALQMVQQALASLR